MNIENITDDVFDDAFESVLEELGFHRCPPRIEYAVLFPGQKNAVVVSADEYETVKAIGEEGTVLLMAMR